MKASLFWGSYFLLFLGITSLNGQTYLDYIGAGHNEGITVTSSSSNNSDSLSTINGHGVMVDTFGASRFLAQATLGANYAEIHRTANIGVTAWLEEQFVMPMDSVQAIHDSLKQIYVDSAFLHEGVQRVLAPATFKQFAWWQTVMNSNSQLRHRMAVALSEIFVVSDVSDLVLFPRAFANYYDMLQDNAFGNFKDLLIDVSLHPVMGFYLTHINNPKSDPSINRFPDENYARECMQLFTIGLYELNNDGSRKTDANGNWIPTFDNTDITELAKVFTGLSFGDNRPFGASLDYALADYYQPMKMYESQHEQGQKVILKNTTIPNGQTGMQDVEDALEVLFNHPNTGPFFGNFLIQRLVKSNPSPAYVSRVADAFNDNGLGVRGDMKAIIKAILLDPEARDCGFRDDVKHGMLKEPIIRYVQMMRIFNAISPNGSYHNLTQDFNRLVGQRVLSSPSVFNFFQSDYQPLGVLRENNLVAPEFQLVNSNSVINFHNEAAFTWWARKNPMIEESLYKNGPHAAADRTNGDVKLNYSEEVALMNDTDALLARLDLLLTHGDMSQNTKDIIADALTSIGGSQSDERKLFVAIEIIMASPEYNILR
ncbi:MAG: DUF1800 domain-containing protein [Bacteroidota bacterium]